MKYLKISVSVLLLAIITNFTIANAGVIFSRITVIEFLEKDKVNYTQYYEKNNLSYSPTYENVDTFTSLTNPCPNCKILVRALEENGDQTAGLLTVMGKKYMFLDTAPVPGNWRLSVQRYDFTLLNTTTKGYWYLNETGLVN